MKINQFYHFSLLFLFLIRYSSSDTNDCDRYDLECMLGVPPEEETKNFTFCIEGQFVVMNGTSPTTDKYKFVKCSTLAPKCAIKTRKVSTVFEKTVEKGEMKIVTIGCFPANELQRREMENRNLESTRSYDSFYSILKDWNNYDFYNSYFLRNKPNNTLDRYSHEIIWVENPSEDLFDRNNGDENGSDAWTQYFSKGKITPIMLLYTLFICISVIIKLIWMVSTAWKSIKQGYEPVKTEKSKEGIEESIDELD
ncbi:hypothetical protein GCK72_000963 [Caenorhabditis remanei]|uniref:Uncharacterized protein n=1 Tax=Caenorhabditis remanei TaxID=31234 RepID=A0A6A5HNB5_CAERE|nr:hypothetical protein GCK72_000963 [Caenorhabditis remanei]KAF1769149.1 hypothetical protein GCK72_000963 [Caenorhabditis remanei]